MTKRVRLVELVDVPPCDAGAPEPAVLASEENVTLAYYVADAIRRNSIICAQITFERVKLHSFGEPNDEALAGHRLYSAGLKPYSAYQVLGSPLIADLRERNRVHPRHDDKAYLGCRHYIFTFHGSTFEAVADGYAVSTASGAPFGVVTGKLAARAQEPG